MSCTTPVALKLAGETWTIEELIEEGARRAKIAYMEMFICVDRRVSM
jgi:hypothetical protein